LDEKQLLPGDDISRELEGGIHLWDKFLLCASKNSRDFSLSRPVVGGKNKAFFFIAKPIHYVQYSNHNYSMNFNRRYNTGIPQLTERIYEFLTTKDLTGQVENEFQNGNEPTGWATLTVDTRDPKFLNELDGFISNLERIAMREPAHPIYCERVWSLRNSFNQRQPGH
jgi:hypothetical protein